MHFLVQRPGSLSESLKSEGDYDVCLCLSESVKNKIRERESERK